MAEPPRPSPQPPLGPGEKTDPGLAIASPDYVKRKVAEVSADMDELLKRHDNKLTVRSILVAVGAVAAGVIAAITFIDNRVAAATDAGVKVHETRLTALEQTASADRAQNNSRFQRLEDGQFRTDKKLDALLDRLNVRNPAPTPMDGGQ